MVRHRLAFLGFRHNHVLGLYKSAAANPRVEIVAAAEEDPATAAALKQAGTVRLTHNSYEEVYRQVDFEAAAIGDYFARRGSLIVVAMERGKHVLSDKPICTDLKEVEQIATLSQAKRLTLGCLLDLRDHGPYLTMRRLIQAGEIGEVRTITFTAQHPLLLDRRPAWYFEAGKHGGTINDIGIHAIDMIPWLTGRQIVEVSAARAWNARLPQFTGFQDAAQLMLRLDNDGGVLGDVSYLSPDALGYAAEQYWRVTVHGDCGVVESSYNAQHVSLAGADDKSIRQFPVDANRPGGCLDAFLDEIEGKSAADALTSAQVIDASRRTLKIQQAADQRAAHVAL